MSRPSAREPVGRTVSMASTSAVTTASTNEVSAVYVRPFPLCWRIIGLTPSQVASARDLESEFAKMHPAFEGKETEHNWQARDRHVARIRGGSDDSAYEARDRLSAQACFKARFSTNTSSLS